MRTFQILSLGWLSNLIKSILLLLIKIYQNAISPFLPARCRYWPSCSHYCAEAINKYGAIRGVFLGCKRLSRCHPWGGSGVDPIP